MPDLLLFTLQGPEILVIFLALLTLVPLALTIWACLDIAKHDFRKPDNKVIWVLLAIFLSPIGPIIYFIMRDDLIGAPSQPIHRS